MTQSCLSGGVVASKGRESCAFAELPSRQIFNQPFIPSSLPFLSFALQILFYAILKSQVPVESRARLRDFHTLVAAKQCLSGAKNARAPKNLAFERIFLQCPSRLRPRIPGCLGAAFALNDLSTYHQPSSRFPFILENMLGFPLCSEKCFLQALNLSPLSWSFGASSGASPEGMPSFRPRNPSALLRPSVLPRDVTRARGGGRARSP